ncbi:uncharacterized protein [Gossypium hirsutum]|uniref:Uncharacterized protein isoform X2 n=1 Tax=Gossypium hirsutum TaxID=3635 RepID=A0ABM2YIW3_GOSHI|nr:uncharacterized protein LOC121204521 isoform X2 [Gossypium hirsutum]
MFILKISLKIFVRESLYEQEVALFQSSVFPSSNSVNVKTDPIWTHRPLFNLPAVKVRCNGCNRHIGEQFFTLDGHRPLHRVIERSYVLHVNRLLYWDGTQFMNAPPLGDKRQNPPTVRMQIFITGLVFSFISGLIFGFVLYWVPEILKYETAIIIAVGFGSFHEFYCQSQHFVEGN